MSQGVFSARPEQLHRVADLAADAGLIGAFLDTVDGLAIDLASLGEQRRLIESVRTFNARWDAAGYAAADRLTATAALIDGAAQAYREQDGAAADALDATASSLSTSATP
jgi:hypothetical protein